jgi:hypothetical protein
MQIAEAAVEATPFHNARCDVMEAIHRAFRLHTGTGETPAKDRWKIIHFSLQHAKGVAGEVGWDRAWDAGIFKLAMEAANRDCDLDDMLDFAGDYLDAIGGGRAKP